MTTAIKITITPTMDPAIMADDDESAVLFPVEMEVSLCDVLMVVAVRGVALPSLVIGLVVAVMVGTALMGH